MCTTKNYLHALEKEMKLRLNGFQTSLVNATFVSKDPLGIKYELRESERTNSHFEDILGSFFNCYKKGFCCYQVPENEVPKIELKPENQFKMNKFIIKIDPETKDSIGIVWLNSHIKSGHLLCVPPSTAQIAAEISVMEHVGGIRGEISEEVRNEVDSFEERYNLPNTIPNALVSLLQTNELNLGHFDTCEIPEDDYVVLTDNARPGNSEQRKFVCKAVSTTDFCIMVGPPGSGKTTSILELIIQLIRRGKRILLVASTNVAVDNILESLKDHLDLVCVKRYGNDDSGKISNDAKKFIGANFKKTEAACLKKRLTKILERSKAQQLLLENCDVANNENLYDIIQENAPIVAGTTFGAALAEMSKLNNEPPFDYMILDEASKTTIQEFLVPAVLCKHWIVVGDIMQLPPYVCDDDLAENLQICYPDEKDKQREYTVASDTLLAFAGRTFRQMAILVEKESEMDTYLYKKYAKENDILFADADNIEDQKLLPYATIIVGSIKSFNENRNMLPPRITTVRLARDKSTGRVLHELEMQEFESIARYNRETLFARFDENIPREWHDEISWRIVRMFEQRNNNVNVDHSALERLKVDIEKLIPKSDSENCKKNIQIFEQIYLPSCMELFIKGYGEYKTLALFKGMPDIALNERCVTLSFQHRSHQEIAQIASDEFYDGQAMRSEHMKDKREWEYSRFSSHVHWENVKGFCDSKNRNKKELQYIENELKNFCDFCKKHNKNESKWSIAALSFYKEQASELKKICQKIFKDCKNVTFSAGSVDSFQGHEADIVFLSYSNQVPTCFISAPNRLNVAITRARYMMVHVGNWRSMSKAEGALGRIAQKLNKVVHNI